MFSRTHSRFPLLTLYERDRALKELERLRTRVESAQSALDAHVAEHAVLMRRPASRTSVVWLIASEQYCSLGVPRTRK